MKDLRSIDCFVLVIICFISIGVRIFRVGFPGTIVFDEVYFGNFTNAYVNRSFYSDIHPPLGKMTMALVAKLTGYPGHIWFARSLGQPYIESESNFVSLRLTPILFGAFCPGLIYCALRHLGIQYLHAFTGALLTALEMSSIVEARIILSDAVLHFYTSLHILSFCYFLKKQDIFSTLLAGITLGMAISCKLTALGLIALDGITQIVWIFTVFPSIPKIILRATLLLVPMVSVFIICWIIHYDILMYKDHTGAYYEDFWSKYLLQRRDHNKTYRGIRLINRNHIPLIIKDLQRTHKSNMRITSPHAWSSHPINWPLLNDRYVLFHQIGNSQIKCLASPWAVWCSTFFICLTPFCAIFGIFDSAILYSFLGWLFSYLPFVLVPRDMFMYHYIVPLFFACMHVETLSNSISKRFPYIRIWLFVLVNALNVACFVYFAQWIYGTDTGKSDINKAWLDSWMWGPSEPVQNFGEEVINTTVKYGSLRALHK